MRGERAGVLAFDFGLVFDFILVFDFFKWLLPPLWMESMAKDEWFDNGGGVIA